MATICHDRQKLDLIRGKTIFDYADELEVQVPTSCGRTGICHECVVEIQHGMEALSPRGEAENRNIDAAGVVIDLIEVAQGRTGGRCSGRPCRVANRLRLER